MITILEETTKNPITLMGQRAGICWGADITNDIKNYKRGLDCLKSGHGRVLEYVNIEMIIENYSARVIREWYTHIGGAPTRLQESTRYINEGEFNFIIPPKISKNNLATLEYLAIMDSIKESYKKLESLGISKEDCAMILPLGMSTKIVDKRNLRNLIDMSHQRMCNRAYWEYRILFNDICKALSNYSEEWKYLVENYLKPKCEILGYCEEKNSCRKKPNQEEFFTTIKNGKYFEEMIDKINALGDDCTWEEIDNIVEHYL